MSMPKVIARAFLALIIALPLAPALLLAQPASAPAAALTEADITRDSACGSPGVGRVYAGERREQIERREGKPGYRVTAEGYWSVGCKAPAPPPPPKACPGTGRPVEWTVGEHTCTTERPRIGSTPPSGLQQGIRSGNTQTFHQWFGPMRGVLVERCDDGARSVVSATCAPAGGSEPRPACRTG